MTTDAELDLPTYDTVKRGDIIVLTLPGGMDAAKVNVIREHVLLEQRRLGVEFVVMGGGIEAKVHGNAIAYHRDGLARALGHDPAAMTFAPVSSELLLEAGLVERASVEVNIDEDRMADIIITPLEADDA